METKTGNQDAIPTSELYSMFSSATASRGSPAENGQDAHIFSHLSCGLPAVVGVRNNRIAPETFTYRLPNKLEQFLRKSRCRSCTARVLPLASVGRRYDSPAGSLPFLWSVSVSRWQNPVASFHETKVAGKFSPTSTFILPLQLCDVISCIPGCTTTGHNGDRCQIKTYDAFVLHVRTKHGFLRFVSRF